MVSKTTTTHTSSLKNERPSTWHRSSRKPVAPWDIFSGLPQTKVLSPYTPTVSGLRIRVANDQTSRQRAFALGYQSYHSKKFLPAHAKRLMMNRFDTNPETVVFIMEDAHQTTLATVTLVLNSAHGLPCDATFKKRMQTERKQGFRMAEATRFAVSCPEHLKGAINKVMLNILFLYARHVSRVQTFMIEVNPRHVPFYSRHMLFEACSSPRSCNRVKGAPAVLMRLDTALQQRAISEVAGLGSTATGPFARTLYRYFLPMELEARWGRDLAEQHQPMSLEEAKYFGLQHPAAIKNTNLV